MVEGFRGTIFVPSDYAIDQILNILSTNLPDADRGERAELLKAIVLYHLIPDAVVYQGAAANHPYELYTLLEDESILDDFCTVVSYA